MSEVREELNRNLQKQKTRVSMTDDEVGAATAAQVLNTALLGFGDDVSGAIDYLDDIIRLNKTDSRYSEKVAHAKRLRERLSLNSPMRSGVSSVVGGAAAGGAVGALIGGTGLGSVAGAGFGSAGGAAESMARRMKAFQPGKKNSDAGPFPIGRKK
jgi:hypothetical protein